MARVWEVAWQPLVAHNGRGRRGLEGSGGRGRGRGRGAGAGSAQLGPAWGGTRLVAGQVPGLQPKHAGLYPKQLELPVSELRPVSMLCPISVLRPVTVLHPVSVRHPVSVLRPVSARHPAGAVLCNGEALIAQPFNPKSAVALAAVEQALHWHALPCAHSTGSEDYARGWDGLPVPCSVGVALPIPEPRHPHPPSVSHLSKVHAVAVVHTRQQLVQHPRVPLRLRVCKQPGTHQRSAQHGPSSQCPSSCVAALQRLVQC
jgi:hypothetical protein